MITVKNKRWLIIAPALAVVLFIFSAQTAQAQGFGPAAVVISQGFLEGVAKLLAAIVLFILQAVSELAILFVHLLIFIAQQNVFINAQIVQTGWALVKDVSNMIFIVALLVIAVGTILRLENYRYNRLLGRVVVMAFLVNFSMLIAGFFIQAGQVVMLTFVNAFKDAAFGNFATMFGLKEVLKLSTNTFEIATLPTILISLIAGLAMMVTVMVVLLAICVVLAVRIIALWILIILSPLAFALRIVPNTEKYYTQWWSEFTKYVTVGPVLAFFLWLALALHSGAGTPIASPTAISTYEQESGYVQAFATQNLTFNTFVTFFISIIFLIMGLQYAQKSGGAGGAFAGRVAQKGFATARVLTGLNAVRDRTIAPVQGWISNRQQAARARVAERTLTLEGAGARTRAALGRTPVGRALLPGGGTEKAQASANQVERQQQGAFAAQRGYDQMTSVQLQQNLRNTGTSTTDRRMRLAAMETLKKRKELNLEDDPQRQAFERIVNEERMPPTERKRIIDEVADSNIKSTSEDQLRRDAELSDKEVQDEAKRIGKKELSPEQKAALFERKKDMRIRSIEELDRRQLLNFADKREDYGGETGKNRKLYEQLGQDLVVSPEKSRQFRENMMKNNQDMAMNFQFNNLEDAESITKYKSAVQQKQISSSSLTKERLERLEIDDDALVKAGKPRRAVAADILKHIKDISPDLETFQGYLRNIDKEALPLFTKHLDMGGESLGRRAMAAKATGEWGKAFEDEKGQPILKMKDGKVETDSKDRQVFAGQEYFDKVGGAELSRTMTANAISNPDVQEMTLRSDDFKWPHKEALRNRDEDARQATIQGLKALLAQKKALNKDGTINLSGPSVSGVQKQERAGIAKQILLASNGETVPHDLEDISKGGGLDAFQQALGGAKAGELAGFPKSDAFKGKHGKLITESVGLNARLSEIGDLLMINFEFSTDAIRAAENKLKANIAARPKDFNSKSRLRNMTRHPEVYKFVDADYMEEGEDDEDKGGAGSGGPKGPGGGGGSPGGTPVATVPTPKTSSGAPGESAKSGETPGFTRPIPPSSERREAAGRSAEMSAGASEIESAARVLRDQPQDLKAIRLSLEQLVKYAEQSHHPQASEFRKKVDAGDRTDRGAGAASKVLNEIVESMKSAGPTYNAQPRSSNPRPRPSSSAPSDTEPTA